MEGKTAESVDKPLRIGTLSFNINAPDFNYGAMLHSWAFQQYLMGLDCVGSAEVIDYIMPKLEGWNRKHPLLSSPRKMQKARGKASSGAGAGAKASKKPKLAVLRTISKSQIVKVGSAIIRYPAYRRRMRKFDGFIEHNLTVSARQYTNETLEHAKLGYDAIICESDVIWSPSAGKMNPAFFLAFDSMKDMRRIAYAPSMADALLSDENERELGELLRYVQFISCRESYEVGILERHTDKPVAHVLDPVLLLDAANYDPITAPPLTDKPYMLLYLPVNDNKMLKRQAKKYAAEHGLAIIEISTKLSKGKDTSIRRIVGAGMEEFLSAVRNADMVFTNSFHAICFSILFHRQFYAFTRKYQKKVRDICVSFGLESRYFDDDVFRELEPIDYNDVQELLDEKRRESQRWLEDALRSPLPQKPSSGRGA